RASFDLTGLPPTPEEIDLFLSDESEDAWPNLLKLLLASERLGERWARHWLDTARFAESHGFEHDYDRPFAFHYRDFVIKALNQDLPYDQFVKWQLAGDEFEPDNSLAMMATGFLGAGVFPTQITKNEVERTRYDALDDMAATMGTSMLGMTIGCARCHDHKFDPIPASDYYRLLSTFTTTVRSNIDLDLTPASYREAKAKFDNEHEPIAKALSEFEEKMLPARFEQWLANRPKGEAPKSPWMILDMVETKSREGATFTRLEDGSYLVSGTNANFDEYTFVAHTNLQGLTSIRLEPLADKSMTRGGPGRAGNGNFALSDFHVTAAPLDGKGKPVEIKLVNPRADFNQGNHLHVSLTIDGDKKSSWAVDPQFGKDHAAVWDFETDVGLEGGTALTITILFNNNTSHNIGRPRLSISTQARPVPLLEEGAPQELVEIFSLLDGGKGELSAAQKQNLMRWYKRKDPEWLKLNQTVQEHLKGAPRPSVEKVMVASEGFQPIRHHTQGADFFEETFLLNRGDTDQKQGVASQSFLQVLMRGGKTEKDWLIAPPKGWRTSYRRSSLANWITDVENGAGNLLARVMVNRLWHHHFGRGIVGTPNDFGFQGERPSHPELLEWLADDLVANGWKLKRLHQMIMNSSVYMESSASSKEKVAADPGNQLRWQWERRRLESEAVRDALLFVSGSLDEQMYGKGTLDEGMSRRSIYFTVKRSHLIPTMVLFDFPESLVSIGRRDTTTIAPQALMLMNNERMRNYSKSFAKRLSPMLAKSTADAVRAGYRIALSREPDSEESSSTGAFIDRQNQAYKTEGRTDSKALAMADFCQVLLSLNEFIYVE
ncbi:MAG: DUF1549 and DUF1553 domain-containing protein, partial [Planctomycetota bacterium]|nr:DUF1549 and DUF1553 domain-containing protein [Planctomycetota bacterium]